MVWGIYTALEPFNPLPSLTRFHAYKHSRYNIHTMTDLQKFQGEIERLRIDVAKEREAAEKKLKPVD